jgi:hypothetical protein
MSRHVLTHTLLDFGSSLWRSATVYEEFPGLAKSGFEPVGKFGIGSSKSLDEELIGAFPTLVAWLCPASPIEIRTVVNQRGLGAAVNPEDWRSLEDKVLTSRVGCEAGKLFPVSDEHGVVFGRIGVIGSAYTWSQAAIVFHGIRCGRVSGLIGLIEACDNNADARRVEARVKGSLSSWMLWAQHVVSATPDPPRDLLLRLHPLLPHLDFPVWFLERQRHSLASLANALQHRSDVLVIFGELSHQDYDQVGSDMFGALFRVNPDILVIRN